MSRTGTRRDPIHWNLLLHSTIYRWLSARLWYLHCVRYKDTPSAKPMIKLFIGYNGACCLAVIAEATIRGPGITLGIDLANERRRYMVRLALTMGMGLTNERRHYIVTPPLSGWAHTQNDSWGPLPCCQLQNSVVLVGCFCAVYIYMKKGPRNSLGDLAPVDNIYGYPSAN